MRTTGVPVIALDASAAAALVTPLGLDLSPFLGYDAKGASWERSAARDLGVSARVEVPLRVERNRYDSVVADVPDLPDALGRTVVFSRRNTQGDALEPARAEVMVSLATLAARRRAPLVLVDFDGRGDASAIRQLLARHRVVLVLLLEPLGGGLLRFRTANGDLIPAIDLYAERVGARYEVTRRTAAVEEIDAPFPGVRTVAISAVGPGDARSDVSALIAYLIGRASLGAPELPR